MEFVAKAGANGSANGDPVDWNAVKAAILANLNVSAEYERLGVEFTRPDASAKGWRECRAVGRKDAVPSAAVNLKSGVYHDSGGEGVTVSLWDFALQHGGYGRWIEVMEHYGARAGITIGHVRAGKGGKIKEAEYLYHNTDESVAYAVFRYRLPNGKKTFSQHPPDGKGGWQYGSGCMDGVKPVPYRLPQLLATDAAEEPVWVVEGEKDADRLAALGLTATTNHQGSGATDATWPRFLEYFAGRECYILPDNDDAGRKHAARVAAYLKPVARSVKVVELPGMVAKGDVSDWFDSGHDVIELGRLAYEGAVWTPEGAKKEDLEKPPEKTVGRSGREYDFPLTIKASQVKRKNVEWLYENRIAYGFLNLFAGRTKIGKSFVTLDIAARLSVGGEIPLSGGLRFEPASTLVISEDSQEVVLTARLEDAGADMDRIDFMTLDAMAAFSLGDVEMLDDTYHKSGCPRLIVIDPPTNFLGGKDEHKNAEIRGMLMGVSIWAMRYNIAVVLITHCNKGNKKDMAAIDRIIGSIAWASTVRIAHIFGPHPDVDGEFVFAPLGSNIGELVDALSYKIVKGVTAVKVEWIGSVEMNADDMMSGTAKKPRGVEAAEWMTEKFETKREWLATELRQDAMECGLSRNAMFSPEVKALPIKKQQVSNATGERYWVWTAKDGWPES